MEHARLSAGHSPLHLPAMWLAPGRRAALTFQVPKRRVGDIALVAMSAGPARLEVRVDGGRPKRRPGVVFRRSTRAVTHHAARQRVAGQRAWVVHRPMKAVRESERMIVALRDDLHPGAHELVVVNRGSEPTWVRGVQWNHGALD